MLHLQLKLLLSHVAASATAAVAAAARVASFFGFIRALIVAFPAFSTFTFAATIKQQVTLL